MRRACSALIGVLLLATVLGGSASARTLTSHSDPNDAGRGPDIRRVWTDKTKHDIYVRIRAWSKLQKGNVGFAVLLDTRGDSRFERLIEMYTGTCYLWRLEEDGFLGKLVGKHRLRRPDGRTAACEVPKRHFRIGKPVRLLVWTGVPGFEHRDRAPNEGRYVGL